MRKMHVVSATHFRSCRFTLNLPARLIILEMLHWRSQGSLIKASGRLRLFATIHLQAAESRGMVCLPKSNSKCHCQFKGLHAKGTLESCSGQLMRISNRVYGKATCRVTNSAKAGHYHHVIILDLLLASRITSPQSQGFWSALDMLGWQLT